MLEFNVLSPNIPNIYNTLIIKNYAYSKPYFRVLFDTGASIPVWVGGMKAFESNFSNFENTSILAIMKGFGRGYEYASVYKIPEFVLRDAQDNSFTILNLYIAVIQRDFSFKMILSFPTLEKTNCHYVSYTDGNNAYEQILPLFRIYPCKNTYVMAPSIINITDASLKLLETEYPDIRQAIIKSNYKQLLHYVYTFTQD